MNTDSAKLVLKVIEAVKCLPVGHWVDERFVLRETGVELDDLLVEALRKSEDVDVDYVDGKVVICRLGKMHMRNKASMLRVIGSVCERGKQDALAAMTVSKEQLEKAYIGSEQDVLALVEEGEICKLERAKDVVYFKPPPGAAASSDIQELWHSIKVPDGRQLVDTLVEKGEISREEVERREMRDKLSRACDKRDNPHASGKKMRVMNMTNAHMFLPRNM